MPVHLEFLDDPGAFLRTAADLLASAPVESTIVATVADRLRRDPSAWGVSGRAAPTWWLVVRDDAGAVVGAGMSTAPFPPYPPYLLSMPDDGALALARALHDRDEQVDGVNGALPAAGLVAAETARLTGRTSRVVEHLRLHELGALCDPVEPRGRARRARVDEVDLVLAWAAWFARDAAEQAGRTEPHASASEDRASMLRTIDERRVWVWEDEAGVPAHLTMVTLPAFGVARIGPVFTPRDRRGRGYAGATVAAVCREQVAAGVRVCLFTDQANPVSNRVYEALGYRPVVDMANIVLE
jgi:GNAT superfamily N-acetyltransferase